jgi:hypothetical protein
MAAVLANVAESRLPCHRLNLNTTTKHVPLSFYHSRNLIGTPSPKANMHWCLKYSLSLIRPSCSQVSLYIWLSILDDFDFENLIESRSSITNDNTPVRIA